MNTNERQQNMDSRSPIKAGIGYTVGNYLLKGIGFITVPIFTRLLTKQDFGIYNTFLAYDSILYIIISFALHASLKNGFYKFENQINEYVSSISVIPLISTVICIFACIFWGDEISNVIHLDSNILMLLVIHSYCTGLVIFYNSRISLDYRYKEYLKISFVNALLNILLSLLLIFTVYSTCRYYGRIVGSTGAYVVVSIYILYKLYTVKKPKFNKEYWKYAIKISAPIVPHGLSQILLLQFDRIMINAISGADKAGIYSFSYTIYSIIQITTNSLDNAFSPWAFQKFKNNQFDEIQRIGKCFILFITGMITVTMLLSPEFIYVLGGENYRESFYSTLPVLFAGFFATSYSIPCTVEYYYEKTNYVAIGTIIAAVINIGLNMIFIPRLGYIAAAYTTLISYIFYYFIHMFLARKLLKKDIVTFRFILSCILIVSIAFISSLFFMGNILVRIGISIALCTIGIFMITYVYGLDNFIKTIKKIIYTN